MKKTLATIALVAATYAGAQAQAVLGYTVSESSGTYTALTEPTVIFNGAEDGFNGIFYRAVITPEGVKDSMGSAEGFSLGFTVDIAGETYTDFLVSTSGYVYLGNGTISYNPMMSQNFLTYGSDFVNVGFAGISGCGFTDATRISYKTLGTGEEARLVVEYSDYIINDSKNRQVPVDAQVILDKSGRVQVVFSGFSEMEDEQELNFYIGVRQKSSYVSANGEYGSLATVRNSREAAVFSNTVADGATVTFNIPTDCVCPEAQPTDLVLTATTSGVSGSFEAAADADLYLVAYAEGDAAFGTPENGTVYKAGDALGDAKVVYYGPNTEFTLMNLEGGINYTFKVYALNAYGFNGPVYNTEEPLAATVATLPAGPAALEFTGTSLDTITLAMESNEAGDDVVVVYNSYVERVNTGDHGYFGTLPADAKAGDVLPVPEDFEPYWDIENAQLPENAGTVAFVGKADGSPVTVEGLEPGTGYYFALYTRNAAGEYTSEPIYAGTSTWIENPYSGDSYNFPRFSIPNGWTGSEAGESTYAFRDEEFLNPTTGEVRQGTQIIQQRCAVSRGDATNGKEAWIIPAPLYINDRHCMVKFEYCITQSPTRFETTAYNDWADDDVLEIRLSEDNGETWTTVASYTSGEHLLQEEQLSYVNIAADLNAYRGKSVLVQLYWKTFAAPMFGLNFYLDRFSMTQAEFPAVPEVTVNKIGHDSAVVSWVSQQTDYELVYGEKGGNVTHTVKVAGATSYTLEGLLPNTEYEVKVRGVIAGEDDTYSEWSDPVEFTTTDYPAVDAPENIQADTETFAALGYVMLSWDKAEDAIRYEVAYRVSSSTEWIYENSDDTSLLLKDLEPGEQYVAKVRAFCTHDRETAYSAQIRFAAPKEMGVDSPESDGVTVKAGEGYVIVAGAEGGVIALYNASGLKVAGTDNAASEERYALESGVYVVTVNGKSVKAAVR